MPPNKRLTLPASVSQTSEAECEDISQGSNCEVEEAVTGMKRKRLSADRRLLQTRLSPAKQRSASRIAVSIMADQLRTLATIEEIL